MSFFRANLIGLKADRDKKEIGIYNNWIEQRSDSSWRLGSLKSGRHQLFSAAEVIPANRSAITRSHAEHRVPASGSSRPIVRSSAHG